MRFLLCGAWTLPSASKTNSNSVWKNVSALLVAWQFNEIFQRARRQAGFMHKSTWSDNQNLTAKILANLLVQNGGNLQWYYAPGKRIFNYSYINQKIQMSVAAEEAFHLLFFWWVCFQSFVCLNPAHRNGLIRSCDFWCTNLRCNIPRSKNLILCKW